MSSESFSMHPDTFRKVEMITMWGFPAVVPNWNYSGYEGGPVRAEVSADGMETVKAELSVVCE